MTAPFLFFSASTSSGLFSLWNMHRRYEQVVTAKKKEKEKEKRKKDRKSIYCHARCWSLEINPSNFPPTETSVHARTFFRKSHFAGIILYFHSSQRKVGTLWNEKAAQYVGVHFNLGFVWAFCVSNARRAKLRFFEWK